MVIAFHVQAGYWFEWLFDSDGARASVPAV
jgi:hypothetical protein